MSDGFSHLDSEGSVHMVDVGGKQVTSRRAVAEVVVTLDDSVRDRLFTGDLPKGDALAMVRVAAIMAAKRTPELVPLCHPVSLDAVTVDIEPTEVGARIVVTATVAARTGVEMEAMTGAAVGAVALYDMIKGLDRGAEIGSLRLVSKSGGKSGEWHR
jgi:cyclic pyranopterin phosphate synthase